MYAGWQKEWDNITKENSKLLSTYILPNKFIKNREDSNCYNTYNTDMIDKIKYSLDENTSCRLRNIESYDNFINLIINVSRQ